jgi:hypothetical protein
VRVLCQGRSCGFGKFGARARDIAHVHVHVHVHVHEHVHAHVHVDHGAKKTTEKCESA